MITTITGNTVRIQTTWRGWDDNAVITVDNPRVTITRLGVQQVVIDMIPGTGTAVWEAYWTPDSPGLYDVHASATVDGLPQADHTQLSVRG